MNEFVVLKNHPINAFFQHHMKFLNSTVFFAIIVHCYRVRVDQVTQDALLCKIISLELRFTPATKVSTYYILCSAHSIMAPNYTQNTFTYKINYQMCRKINTSSVYWAIIIITLFRVNNGRILILI